MDYSLLIGVRREKFRVVSNPAPNEPAANSNTDHEVIRMGEDQKEPAVRSESNSMASQKLARWRMQSRAISSSEGSEVAHLLIDGGMKAVTVEGPGTYYVGLIDILQEWTWQKRLERFAKMYLWRLDGDGLSALPPESYAKRFWRRCVLDTFEGLELVDDGILGNYSESTMGSRSDASKLGVRGSSLLGGSQSLLATTNPHYSNSISNAPINISSTQPNHNGSIVHDNKVNDP